MNKPNTSNGLLVIKFANAVIKWRWLVLLATLTFTVFAGSGGRFLSFNNDYHIFFGEDNPQLKAFDALQKNIPKMIISSSPSLRKTARFLQTKPSLPLRS